MVMDNGALLLVKEFGVVFVTSFNTSLSEATSNLKLLVESWHFRFENFPVGASFSLLNIVHERVTEEAEAEENKC